MLGSITVAALLSVFLLATVPSMAAPQTTKYLTTDLTAGRISWTQLRSYTGVLVNYTSVYPTAITAFVYASVLNPSGQTVAVSVGTCNFGGNQTALCFVAFLSTFPTGTWTVNVFATSPSLAPISTTSSFEFTV